jgi:hypothetical protein
MRTAACALWTIATSLATGGILIDGFVIHPALLQRQPPTSVVARPVPLRSTYEDEAPSDFNTEDLEGEKHLTIDDKAEDVVIRDALKRELLLLSSITNRGEYAVRNDW